MTELNVTLVETILNDDAADLTPDTPIAVLTETFFILPVALIVNGQDVFGYSHVQTGQYHSGIDLPVVSIIVEWPIALEKLKNEGEAIVFLADAGRMRITSKNGKIKITTTINALEIEEDHSEFDREIRSTIDVLVHKLNEKVPMIFEHRDLRKVIRG